MPRPDEYSIFILLDGGHREELRVRGAKEMNKIVNDLFRDSSGEDLINLPKTMDNEFLIVRPSRVCGVVVEPVFASSVGLPD